MQKQPVFTGVIQVCVVVKDVDKAVRRFADVYGIGPWQLYTCDGLPERHAAIHHMIIRDKPMGHALRLAYCMIGSTSWELIQPLDDHSIFAEFLREHGEGVQHIAFATNDP